TGGEPDPGRRLTRSNGGHERKVVRQVVAQRFHFRDDGRKAARAREYGSRNEASTMPRRDRDEPVRRCAVRLNDRQGAPASSQNSDNARRSTAANRLRELRARLERRTLAASIEK